ncbi:unnamed protein product [Brachionus calyciflorus]|uniref:Uncharacterized protein n=1 Tax=Brachionus calyciflorus TaxID=104777 RepID=A0A814S259_9BILA|nr:unnamed protein product [Brachionus calyciflorus]
MGKDDVNEPHYKMLTKSSSLRALGGFGLANLVIEAAAFGGAGALVFGGIAFPTVGAILLATAVGGIATGGIVYLIKKLWDGHQIKALEFLEKILSHLNKLQNANTSFVDYMNKSEEKTNAILSDFESIQKNLINGSKRYRVKCSELCKKACESTESMIKMIDEIDTKIDMTSWTSSEIKNDDDSLVLARN